MSSRITVTPEISPVKKMIRQLAFYVPSQFLSQFLGFFTSIIMRRCLGPVGMGLWGTVQVVIAYAGYTHLGVRANIFYRVPVLRGEGKEEEINDLQNLVFTFLAASISVIAAGITAYAFWHRQSLEPKLFYGLISAGIILCVQRFFAYYVAVLRANKNFELLSRQVIFDALVNFILVVALVGKWGFYGLLVSAVLMPVLNVCFIRFHENIPLKLYWDSQKFKGCLKYGFPIFVRDWLNHILNSVDRVMIVSMLGFKALGLFSVATMTKNYSHGLYRNFSHVISPYLLEEYGRSDDIRSSARYVEKPTLILTYFMMLVLGSAYFLSYPLIYYVLPDFITGLPVLRLYLLTALFAVLSTQSVTLITALNKQSHLIPISLGAIVLNVLLNWFFIRSGKGILGVAAATSIVSAGTFVVTYSFAMMHAYGAVVILRQLMRISFPVLYCSFAAYGIQFLMPADTVLICGLLQWILYIAVFLPLLYFLNQSTHVLSFFMKWFSEKKIRRKNV